MMTGYFASIGKRATKVHIVNGNGRPICRSVIGGDQEFQWCSGRVYLPYVDYKSIRRLGGK